MARKQLTEAQKAQTEFTQPMEADAVIVENISDLLRKIMDHLNLDAREAICALRDYTQLLVARRMDLMAAGLDDDGSEEEYQMQMKAARRAEKAKEPASPAERPAHTPLPPLYLGDHEHKFMCATDEQQCDGECKASHRCSVCHKRNDKLGWPSRLTPLQIREAQLRTACNNYEALKLSHAALVEAAEFFMEGYNSGDGMTSMKHYAWKFDTALANAKALEGL